MSLQILNLDELQNVVTRYTNKLPEFELMRRAGAAICDVIAENISAGNHIVIACGPGNNGGDGFAAALHLKERGYKVTCALIGVTQPKTKEALSFYNAWLNAGGLVIQDPYNVEKAACVVDALFGTGLQKPLSGEYQDAAMWFNERQALHVAIDIPSGIDSLTGNWVGKAKGCKADMTIALLSPKAGCYMNEGADAAGKVIVKELDVSIPLASIELLEEDSFRHVLAPREKNTHKGTYGHVAVLGGETGTIGAALLAARSALTLGAGRVTCEMMSEKAPAVDLIYPELMMSDGKIDLTQTSCNVVGCGMGFSDKAKERFKDAIAANVPLIIDADALRMLADDIKLQDAVLARKAHTVITPHPAEAAAILRCPIEKIINDRVGSARELSIQTGAVSILKGIGSVVTLRSSRTWINPTGNAMLATAGSGDVLSGMLGAMFAQNFDLVSATLSAVWLHGKAAEGRYAGFKAQEIAPQAAKILEEKRKNYARG